jgi:acetolactate synthase-1/2/3 large subunit
MNGQELATAVQYDAAVRILVIDNGTYGTIRAHQERHYPGRVIGTDLRNPDFAALARAYGAEGFSANRDADVVPALDGAFAAKGPSLVHIKIATEAISPTATITQLRESSLAKRAKS